MSSGTLRIKDADPQQNEERSTITICDKAFNKLQEPNIYARLGDIPSTKDLTKTLDTGVKSLKDMMSIILVHEVRIITLV